MNPKLKSFILWIIAFILTLVFAVYQRMTGPTYEIREKATIGKQVFPYKLIRTYDGTGDALISIRVPDTVIKGEIKFKRFKSDDAWTVSPMHRMGDQLNGSLPHQPPAGKVAYQVTLISGDQRYLLNEDPAVLRYKGHVPGYVLIPHIIIIFLAMLFSTRAGFEAIFRGKHTYLYAWITVITLFIGGLIMGPFVQKLSFGMYWAGWPFGHDLTDNKSLVAFIFWIIALWILHKNRERRLWPVIASAVLLLIFLIPHSMLGSEIDYSKQPKTEQTR